LQVSTVRGIKVSIDKENQAVDKNDQSDEQLEQARRDKERELFKGLFKVKTYPVVLEPDEGKPTAPDK
jgi:hypothetical protein